ncbi:Active breakpoint cluster region-related protein isoform 2 [Schistosoma japonicum]|uniref:Active breakpoint cluster region-related protein isoform 2 n=1 Tax=Schistosoma japonicum TaxID=6182 RepID=A0A4Z2CTA1_SCHJA|nr:Active breakpoint cluster region-related protein isoform 2 [Schistosoma japonicum]
MHFESKHTYNISTVSTKDSEGEYKKKYGNIKIYRQNSLGTLDEIGTSGKQFKLLHSKDEMGVRSYSIQSLEPPNVLKTPQESISPQLSAQVSTVPLKFVPVNVKLLSTSLQSDSSDKTVHKLFSRDESCKLPNENDFGLVSKNKQIKALNQEDSPDNNENVNKIRLHLNYLHKQESQHLKNLEQIQKSLDFIKERRSLSEIKAIRSSISSIESIQRKFVHGLKVCLENGDIQYVHFLDPFKLLIDRQIEISNYVNRISNILHNLKHDRPDSPDNKSLDSFRLQEPMTWITQTVENIKIIVLLLDEDSIHYPELYGIYKRLMEESLNLNNGKEDKTTNDTDRLVMHSLVVELTNKTNSRKLRYLLLFKDVLICAKLKFTVGSSRQKLLRDNASSSESRFRMKRSEKLSTSGYELDMKWSIPLDEINLLTNSRVGNDDRGRLQNQRNLDELKGMVRNLRQIMNLSPEEKHSTKNTSKLTSLSKLEGKLVLETPQLILPIADKFGRVHNILLSTERERVHWRSALEQLLDKPPYSADASDTRKRSTPEKRSVDYLHPISRNRTSSVGDLGERLKKYKHMITLNKIGFALIGENEPITGFIKTTIHGIYELDEKKSYHVRIEVDSYGQYEEVARTRVLQQTNPQWEQSFDLEVDGAWTMCFILYVHQEMLAELEVPLGLETLKDNSQINMKTLTNENPPRELVFSVSLEYVDQMKCNKNRRSEIRGNLFGRRLEELIKVSGRSDNKLITTKHKSEAFVPQFVTACVEEIERRGLLEVGIYRLCGSNDDIKALQNEFDESCTLATRRLPLFELPVIASLLKQFFQHLPESLIDHNATIALLQAVEIPDESVRLETIKDILLELPTPNLETFNYLANHLVTVSNYKMQNKMDLGNLSLIWSFTLFECAPEISQSAETKERPTKSSSCQVDAVQRQAAYGFQQAKALNCILTSIKSGKLTIPFHDNVIRTVYS